LNINAVDQQVRVTTHDVSSRALTRERSRRQRSNRAALAIFCVVEVLAFALFVSVGRRSWFRWDDWDYLVGRNAGDISSLLKPHDDQLVMTVVITYRSLWNLFGLRFAPYLISAVSLHLTAAALLWQVIRRAGVRPWIATGAASLFAFLRSGDQITAQLMALNFSGWAIVLGLTYLLLVDHDGALDWRDALAFAAGFGAMASSGVGVTLVVAAGAAMCLRRGPRIAALHVSPLAALYVSWYIAFSTKGGAVASLGQTVKFAVRMPAELFVALGQSRVTALMLAGVLLAGGALAWRKLSIDERRVRISMPVGLLCSAAVFFIATAYGRADFPQYAGQSHYVEVGAVMVLPALAVASDALVQLHKSFAFVLGVLLLIAIPANVIRYRDSVADQEHEMIATRQLMLSLPRAPAAAHAPDALSPEPILASPVTIGWLRETHSAGRLPEPSLPLSNGLKGQLDLRLSIRQTNGLKELEPCRRMRDPVVFRLEKGQSFTIGRGYIWVALLRESGWTKKVKYGDPFEDRYFKRIGEAVTALRGPLTLRLSPVRRADNWICGRAPWGPTS
jgi:hypothetical protein